MTMMHTDTDYNKKIRCSFLVFVILGADSQIFVEIKEFFYPRFSLATPSNQFLTGFSQRGFVKYLLNYSTSGHKLNLFAFKQLLKLF